MNCIQVHSCTRVKTGQRLLWFHNSYSRKLHLGKKKKKKTREQRDTLRLCSSFTLASCFIVHRLWTLYINLYKPTTDTFHQQCNATNTQPDWDLYFSSIFLHIRCIVTFFFMKVGCSLPLFVTHPSMNPYYVLLVQLAFEKSHLFQQKFLQPFKLFSPSPLQIPESFWYGFFVRTTRTERSIPDEGLPWIYGVVWWSGDFSSLFSPAFCLLFNLFIYFIKSWIGFSPISGSIYKLQRWLDNSYWCAVLHMCVPTSWLVTSGTAVFHLSKA